jgi:hypothetical protein
MGLEEERGALADVVQTALLLVDVAARPELQQQFEHESPLTAAAAEQGLRRVDDPIRRMMLTTTVPAAMSLHALADYLRALRPTALECETVLPLQSITRTVIETAAAAEWILEAHITAIQRRARYRLVLVDDILVTDRADVLAWMDANWDWPWWLDAYSATGYPSRSGNHPPADQPT